MTKMAVVTGASSGLGKAYAELLAADGYCVLLFGRRESELKNVLSSLSPPESGNHQVHVMDLTKEESQKQLEKILESEPVEVLVNNAGFGTTGLFHEVDQQKSLALQKLQTENIVRFSRAVLPGMIARNQGYLVNVSSLLGNYPTSGNAIYCATKAFVTNFSESLIREIKKENIHIQALAAGFFKSDFHSREEYKDFRRDLIPAFMWSTSKDVAECSWKNVKTKSSVCVPGLMNLYMHYVSRSPLRFTLRPVVDWIFKRSGLLTEPIN